MIRIGTLIFTGILLGCAGPVEPSVENGPDVPPSSSPPTELSVEASGPLALSQVDDNVRHDTLLIQTTFDLGEGTFVMVASSVDETFEGLRLYRYRVLPDSLPGIIAASTPAYDSWTMLPTFFRHPQDSTAWIILANLGERQSWGQKVFILDAEGFTDMGFLDVALAVDLPEEDGGTKLVGIGPEALVMADGTSILIRFSTAKLYLYDDLAGGRDQVIDAGRVTYRWNSADGMLLWMDEQPRRPEV